MADNQLVDSWLAELQRGNSSVRLGLVDGKHVEGTLVAYDREALHVLTNDRKNVLVFRHAIVQAEAMSERK